MKEKILITGGLGYVGSKFTELYNSDYDLTVIDTNFYNSNTQNNVINILKDIRELELSDIKDIDYVVHMAELSNDPLGELNPEITNEINHLGTIELLKLCEKSDIKKFIYMSSCSVYGKNPNLVNERSQLNPITNYSKAKVHNEEYLTSKKFPFETIILRNATVFGHSNNLRLDLVINDLTYSAFKFKEINLLSDGTPKRPFIHIVDLCRLIKLFLESTNNLNNEIFNIGSNQLNYSIYEIANIIKDLLKIESISIGKKDADQRSYLVDFTKLNNFFPDFRFEFSVEKGIDDMINKFKNFDYNANSIRVKHIKSNIERKKLDENLKWTNEQ